MVRKISNSVPTNAPLAGFRKIAAISVVPLKAITKVSITSRRLLFPWFDSDLIAPNIASG